MLSAHTLGRLPGPSWLLQRIDRLRHHPATFPHMCIFEMAYNPRRRTYVTSFFSCSCFHRYPRPDYATTFCVSPGLFALVPLYVSAFGRSVREVGLSRLSGNLALEVCLLLIV